MNKAELHQSLEALRAEVDKLDAADDSARERLTYLIGDLDRQLENPDDVGHKEALREKIPDLVEQFEVEHPRTTEILNRIMMALSDMGI